MPDETKGPNPVSPPPGGDAPPAAKPAEAAAPQSDTPVAAKPAEAAKPPAPAAAEKPAAAAPATGEKPAPAAKPAAADAAKPAAPAAKPAPKPEGPKPEPWDSDLVSRLRSQYGSGIKEANTYLGQKYVVVDSSILYEILLLMRDDELFDYCVDVTAVHYPKREAQFDIVYVLYSFHHNERVRENADQGRREPAHRGRNLADGQLAGARSLRHVRHHLRRTSRHEAHPPARRMEGPPAAQGLPHPAAGQGVGTDQPWH